MLAIKRHIPNFITCLNLLCGCIAVVFALRGWLGFAVYLVITAAFFDFCDGLAARLLRAYSSIGKQLDSLSDLISFGLTPAAMLHYEFCQILSPKISFGLDPIPWELLSFFPFFLVVAAAFRLAKFNLDDTQNDKFNGLPTPACALIISSLLLYFVQTPKWMPLLNTVYSIPLLVAVLCLLMVSNIPMISLKIKSTKWKGNQIRFLFLSFVLIFIVVAFFYNYPWSFMVLMILLGYLAFSILFLTFVPVNKKI
ncbi:MAG: CDP-alcohol phosphatidyltransferase family protein [Prevotellaceae bacterium]|jgi:CDP-diacylglycerol--serine O-phosphatidyltransferase|nr:CDP-alcohol phosphatidyltransferase family protein [Prevotellaceae bacterium]